MHDTILQVSTRFSMAAGGGTVASTWLGIPVGEWGQLLGGLAAAVGAIIAVLTYLRNRKP